MATSTHVSRLCRSGGVPAPVRIAAARAALFAVAFPPAGQPNLVSRQLALAAVGRTLGVCWFTTTTEPAYERLSTAWPFVIAHLDMTVLLAVLLHGVRDGRTGLHRGAGELRSLCAWLWRLLFPREGVESAVVAPEVVPVHSAPDRPASRHANRRSPTAS
ncbi:hypothetical protein [Streptomyces sp. NPDC051572]|uniref:hypothetical protein n=1 Tax=Streptomyces sp. NPDC051572 TaxID=3155802 RepID=UPI00344C4C67